MRLAPVRLSIPAGRTDSAFRALAPWLRHFGLVTERDND
jgi:hypothetical protein